MPRRCALAVPTFSTICTLSLAVTHVLYACLNAHNRKYPVIIGCPQVPSQSRKDVGRDNWDPAFNSENHRFVSFASRKVLKPRRSLDVPYLLSNMQTTCPFALLLDI
jgi:hypothetical protein